MGIEAVILYSTNDFKFFKPCIENLIKCNIKCHIVTYSHMWDGEDENTNSLDKSFTYFKDNDLVKFYQIEWHKGENPWYWEGLGRYLATQQVSDHCDYVLYIDIDEIVDSKIFIDWINKEEYKQYDALKISNYWYWREPEYQSNQLEDSIVMAKTSLVKNLPFQQGGREQYFNLSSNIIRFVNNQNPMIHHYSWVRTKEEMLKKVQNWGHKHDKNWTSLIEEEFNRPFNGTDFINEYTYNIVTNKFNIK